MPPADMMARCAKASHRIMTTDNNFDRRLPITRTMTYGQMRAAVSENTSLRVNSAEIPGDACGLYDESLQAIVIDIRMTYVSKKCALVHELFHWMHADDCCAGSIGGRAERRAREETAMFLISPDEYVIAEREYDGEIYLMACELDVTVDVLEDYRRLLESGHGR